MKIKELLKYGSQILDEGKINDANLKAKLLLSYILSMDKNDLIICEENDVTEEQEIIYKNHLKEILTGKPIQYVTHKQEFIGLSFYVDENVLIPQPDTEILVEETLKIVKEEIIKNQTIQETNKLKGEEEKKNFRILDLCTGSGAIAVSLTKLIEKYKSQYKSQMKFEVYGTDISSKALEVARKNAKTQEVDVIFIQSDMFENVKDIHFDIIVSNPPYIETNTIETLPMEVQQEPFIALDGGSDGLDFYRIIAIEARKYLKEKAQVLVEIGYNQKESVIKILKNENYKDIECVKDLAGNDRVIKGKLY